MRYLANTSPTPARCPSETRSSGGSNTRQHRCYKRWLTRLHWLENSKGIDYPIIARQNWNLFGCLGGHKQEKRLWNAKSLHKISRPLRQTKYRLALETLKSSHSSQSPKTIPCQQFHKPAPSLWRQQHSWISACFSPCSWSRRRHYPLPLYWHPTPRPRRSASQILWLEVFQCPSHHQWWAPPADTYIGMHACTYKYKRSWKKILVLLHVI